MKIEKYVCDRCGKESQYSFDHRIKLVYQGNKVVQERGICDDCVEDIFDLIVSKENTPFHGEKTIYKDKNFINKIKEYLLNLFRA